MKSLFRICVFVFAVAISNNIQASIDSLRAVCDARIQQDSIKLDLLLKIAWEQKYNAAEESEKYAERAFSLSKKLQDSTSAAGALKILGILSDEIGKYSESIEYYLGAISYLNPENDKSDIAKNEANIGIIYRKLKQYDVAIKYFENAIIVMRDEEFLYGEMLILQNMGLCYIGMDKIVDAEKVLKEALIINEDNNFNSITIYGNLGLVYLSFDEYEKAIGYFEKCVNEIDRLGMNPAEKQVWLNNLAESYRRLGDIEKARLLNEQALNLLGENIYTYESTFTHSSTVKIYQALGDYEMALDFHMKLMRIKDTIYRSETTDKITQMEEQYEAEKKDLHIKALNEKAKVDQIELDASRRENSILLVGFLSIGFLGVIVFRGYLQKKKSNRVITSQNTALGVKNKEILDSITYAKRLQDAILPSDKLVSSYLLESFILYKPKDIVAGDFYFMDVVQEGDVSKVYYAAADCTGHGVPGAMVSIVGANGLKRCIQEFGLRTPGEILDRLSLIVTENFSQSEERIRDGMDIALCCLEVVNNRIHKIHYAGANNSLWVINPNRKELPENAVYFNDQKGFEIKANKQSIGYGENQQLFKTHTFDVLEGDTFYTFSDGFSDQFGGEKGKKYKSSNFKTFLMSIRDKELVEQKQLINEEFEKWKGDIEQLDDVCIIGVRA